MSEPSSSVPGEIADGGVDQDAAAQAEPERVELDVDEEKLEAWDEVKSDYEIEPDGKPVPNSMDPVDLEPVEDNEDDEDAEDAADGGDAGDDRGEGAGAARD
jgi:hypothetical protein